MVQKRQIKIGNIIKEKKEMAEKQINITLNVDDELFNKLIADGIEALPKKELNKILLDGLKSSFKSQCDKLYSSNYGYSSPVSEMFNTILKNFDYDKYFGEITEEISKYIKDNYKSIVLQSLCQKIAEKVFRSDEVYELQTELQNHIYTTMNQ